MENKLPIKNEESAGLRCQLEACLTSIFAGGNINDYMVVNCYPVDLKFLPIHVDQVAAFSQIRLAYAIWLGMRVTDRHAVLAKFQQLYAALPARPANRQTLTFCAVFIQEFADILAEAMMWPD